MAGGSLAFLLSSVLYTQTAGRVVTGPAAASTRLEMIYRILWKFTESWKFLVIREAGHLWSGSLED